MIKRNALFFVICVSLSITSLHALDLDIPVNMENKAKDWGAPPSCAIDAPARIENLLPLVNHRTGINFGNTITGPFLPNGVASSSPHSERGGTNHYSEKAGVVEGFGQMHVHGTGGAGTYGQLAIFPHTGDLRTRFRKLGSKKANEIIDADYYAVTLTDFDTRVEVTPTHNVNYWAFTYPQTDKAQLLFDPCVYGTVHYSKGCFHGGCHMVDASLSEDGKTLTGKARYSGGWCTGMNEYYVYFTIELSRAASAFGTWKDDEIQAENRTVQFDKGHWEEEPKLTQKKGRVITGPHEGFYFTFDTQVEQRVEMKISVSFRNIENSQHFIRAQIGKKSFDAVRKDAQDAWNAYLSRIIVEGGPEKEISAFYSFLHHTRAMPRNKTGDDPYYMNGDYWDDHYSTWDTWRSLFPLYSLIDHTALASVVNGLTNLQKSLGCIPKNFVAGKSGVFALSGICADNIVAEAIIKDIPGLDIEQAWTALRATVCDTGRKPDYKERGWIPFPKDKTERTSRRSSCSNTLEYAIADYNSALAAQKLGHAEDASMLFQRSRSWQNIWNPEALDKETGIKGFIVPRNEDGTFLALSESKKSQKGKKDLSFFHLRSSHTAAFTEGTAWTYSFLMNHDVHHLIELCGGKEAFIEKMEAGYSTHGNGKHGVMGLGNEPGFFIPWMACYANRPDMTARFARVNALKGRGSGMYTAGGNYPGGEDSGAMSSWWVFWALGLFPNAGSDVYLLHGPFFEKITMQLPNGKTFIIEGQNAGEASPYVQSATLNGQAYNQCWIRHADIMKGGTLSFVMGPEPSAWAHDGLVPPSLSDHYTK